MTVGGLEIGDVFRRYGAAFLKAWGTTLSTAQRFVMDAVSECRTAARGGHVKKCDRCGHLDIWYNSCRNRHCPKCLGAASAAWLEARRAELLPVPYFHLVFTIPDLLEQVALQNKVVVYDILFRATAGTLLTIGADPKHLGAKLGFLAVLHTWGQTLLHHPHIHCIVPGGGLSPDKSQWIPSRENYLLPERVLSPVFRGKFISLLRAAFERQALSFHGDQAHLADPTQFRQLLDSVHAKEWVVYAKKPFGSPEQVLKYLARYTHRVAISNKRLVQVEDDKVTFRYKDYKKQLSGCRMTLDASEFIRRFLLHVLPRSFVRIRHYGFLGNRSRKSDLALCRKLLDATSTSDYAPTNPSHPPDSPTDSPATCPKCSEGRMVELCELAPGETFSLDPLTRVAPS